MRRSKNSRETDESIARAEVEDRIVIFLGKIPPEVALATALSVELSLANRWGEIQDKMIRQSDTRKVAQIIASDMRELNEAIATIPPGIHSDDDAERHVIGILADFPPDWAWWIARKVAKHEANWARMKRTQAVTSTSGGTQQRQH